MERRITQERERETKVKGLTDMLTSVSLAKGHADAEVRADRMRKQRVIGEERREFLQDQHMIQTEATAERKARLTTMEDKVAQEVERRNAARFRYEQDKKRICDSAEELVQLRSQIQQARVNKERAAQLLERQVREEEDRARETILAERMEVERMHLLEQEKETEIIRRAQKKAANEMQLDQIRERELAKAQTAEEFERERKEVDEIVQRMIMEEEREKEAHREAVTQQRKEFAEFMKEREQWRRQQRANEEAEDRRIEEFAAFLRAREERMEEEKRRIEEEKRRMQAEVSRQTTERETAKAELEYLINELYQEQMKAEARAKDEAELRKRMEDRVLMQRAFEAQMASRAEKRRQEQEEEERLRQEVLRKFAEDDRLEAMSRERRRQMIEKHKEQAEMIVEERRRQHQQAREEELRELQRRAEEEERRKRIVEAERLRILREEAAPLKDFLPKGTLKVPPDQTLVEESNKEWRQTMTQKGNLTAVRLPTHQW